MFLRFFRRFHLGKLLQLNVSRSGPSFSLGPPGAKITLGPKGIRKTLGIPGSGIFFTKTEGQKSKNQLIKNNSDHLTGDIIKSGLLSLFLSALFKINAK